MALKVRQVSRKSGASGCRFSIRLEMNSIVARSVFIKLSTPLCCTFTQTCRSFVVATHIYTGVKGHTAAVTCLLPVASQPRHMGLHMEGTLRHDFVSTLENLNTTPLRDESACATVPAPRWQRLWAFARSCGRPPHGTCMAGPHDTSSRGRPRSDFMVLTTSFGNRSLRSTEGAWKLEMGSSSCKPFNSSTQGAGKLPAFVEAAWPQCQKMRCTEWSAKLPNLVSRPRYFRMCWQTILAFLRCSSFLPSMLEIHGKPSATA